MADRERDILELIGAGKKIEAIKMAREHLGMSLAEAKDFVEGLAKDGHAAEVGIDEATEGWDEIDALLRAKKKIDAVRVYRESHGGGLKDGKDAIERRAVQLGLQSRPSKCFIATAACGGGEQADVAALRKFRNRVLKRSRAGRLLVSVYERAGPMLASPVGRCEPLAAAVRVLIRAANRVVDRGPMRD